MLGNKAFYNRTIRKLVVAFGTLFNEIQLVRYNQDNTEQKEIFKVPLVYGPKEKYLTRITADPDLTKSIAINVPRISFVLDSLEYDSSRKQISTLQNFAYTNNTVKSQYVPIPWNFEFSVSIYVRNIEDGTQIVEQILPFFTPDFTITVDFNPGMNQKYDIPVILNSVSTNVEYEGDMSTTRLIIWDLMFTVKGFIWPPAKGDAKLIGMNGGSSIVHIGDYDRISVGIANSTFVTIVIKPDPVDADPDGDYGFKEYILEFPDQMIPAEEPGWVDLSNNFNLANGCVRQDYDMGYFDSDPTWFNSKTPSSNSFPTTIDIGNSLDYPTGIDNYSIQWTGYFVAPSTTNYKFRTYSDDGSYFWIGTSALNYDVSNVNVNNSGYHGPTYVEGAAVYLIQGRWYPIRAQFGESTGGAEMKVEFSTNEGNTWNTINNMVYDTTTPDGFVV